MIFNARNNCKTHCPHFQTSAIFSNKQFQKSDMIILLYFITPNQQCIKENVRVLQKRNKEIQF